MNKLLFIIIAVCISSSVFSQGLNEILNSIESNNKDLIAARKHLEMQKLEFKTDLLPENPEISYGYFPENSTVKGNKQVLEVSQSFEFPSVYFKKSKQANLLIEQADYNYASQRLQVLLDAKLALTELTFLLKKQDFLKTRIENAQSIHDAQYIKFEAGDANIIEFNKAKLFLLSLKRESKELQASIDIILEELARLNGGNKVNVSSLSYQEKELLPFDSVLINREQKSPELFQLEKQIAISQNLIKLNKGGNLPSFSIGYGQEFVADEKFRGVMVGMSIPLWANKNKVKMAKANLDYSYENQNRGKESFVSETKTKHQEASALKETMHLYINTLFDVNNEELLKKSLDLGEISAVDYFTELIYYYEFFDNYLEIERDYYKSLDELYFYEL